MTRKLINIRNDDSYLDIALELLAFTIVAASALLMTAIALALTIAAIVALT